MPKLGGKVLFSLVNMPKASSAVQESIVQKIKHNVLMSKIGTQRCFEFDIWFVPIDKGVTDVDVFSRFWSDCAECVI